MIPDREKDILIQEKIRKILQNPPQHRFSDEKRRELIAKLYKVEEEKSRIVEFIPFKIPEVRMVRAYATVAATVIFTFFGYMYLFAPIYPTVSNVKGVVKIYHSAKNEWEIIEKPRMTLAKNDIVKTFDDGQADVVLSNIYHIRMKNDSEMSLTSANSRVIKGNIRYMLTQGKVFAYYRKVASQKKPLEIETPQANTSALGTDFMVQTMPSMEKTYVGVLDGVVRVTGLEAVGFGKVEPRSVLVEAGERTTVRLGQGPSKPRRLMEDELLELEELYRIGTKPQVALLISTGKTRVRELLSLTPLYISSEKPAVLSDQIEKIARAFSKAIREGGKQKYKDNISQFEDLVNKYPNPKYDVQFLLFIGAYYEYADEHEKAIATFQRVIDQYPKSSLAASRNAQ